MQPYPNPNYYQNYMQPQQQLYSQPAVQQAGTRAILDYLCAKENADLRDKVQKLELSASQDRQNALLTTAMTAQTQQIVNSVNPPAVPAYVVPNPNAYAYGCGCNQSCGC